MDIPKSQRDLIGIERKLKVNESLYVFLLEKKANTVIARAAIIPQTSVIESARSQGVVGPNKARTRYISMGVGFLLAFLIGTIRVVFFDRVDSLRDLKAMTTMPVLGGIPEYKELDEAPIAIQAKPRSNVSEAFRAIRTNLQFVIPEEGDLGRVMLVSSLHPGEGKTFLSTNISSVLAKANKKVVLIDFDLHKPKVHRTFQLENVSGVSSILIGQTRVEQCVVQSQVLNLDIITAGPIPPNASELVLTDPVEELILWARKNYSYVILDTPPIMLISDALVLAKHTDASVFAMNTEKSSKVGVQIIEVATKTS